MALQYTNVIHAAGSIAAAGTLLWSAGCSITDNGTGDYTLHLDEPVDASECSILLSTRGATSAALRCVHTSDANKQVLAFSAADGTTAQDTDVDFVIIRAPG